MAVETTALFIEALSLGAPITFLQDIKDRRPECLVMSFLIKGKYFLEASFGSNSPPPLSTWLPVAERARPLRLASQGAERGPSFGHIHASFTPSIKMRPSRTWPRRAHPFCPCAGRSRATGQSGETRAAISRRVSPRQLRPAGCLQTQRNVLAYCGGGASEERRGRGLFSSSPGAYRATPRSSALHY